MASIDKFKEDRLAKLKKIRKIGWNPYPSSYDKKNTVSECLKGEGKTVKTAGRLFSFRTHGNIAFADIKDESGKIQLFFKKAVLGADAFKNLDLLDIGDFVGVEGEVGKTIAGEISIVPNTYTLLTKAILPLPNSWYGLKDIEDRFRKRYLDLILNPEVKKRIGIRSKIIQSIRNFLDAKNFIEIETPTLQPIYGGGFAKPFKTHFNALDADFYLRISDEMYLKRLIVGGFEKVYEITKVFRNEGYDSDHNPEFTMFEAQIAYQDYYYGMDVIEKIIENVAMQVHGSTKFEYQGTQMSVKSPWPRYRVAEAIKKYTNEDTLLWKTLEEAKKRAVALITNKEKHEEIARTNSIGEIIALLFEERVESNLLQPTIIYDYPIEVSPLAKKCEDPRFTQRFEMFAFGSELGNNYSELNDPIDLRKRFVDEKKREKAGFEDAHQTDYDYIEAIEHGFPLTCGIAIGIDRLVMLLTNATNIKEVIPFPTLRPVKNSSDPKPKITVSTKVVKNPHFYISDQVIQKFPDMKVGYAIIEGVSIKKQNGELDQLKKSVSSSIQSSLSLQDLDSIPSIKMYRSMFKTFGVDWQKRHPSADALLRRIIQGKGLYNINTLVDAYNVAVLDSKIALGAFDRKHLEFPTTLRFAAEGEKIRLLGDDEDTLIHEGELIYADSKKNMTLDLNYRDCDDTKITEKTKDVVLYADGGPEMSVEELKKGLEKGIELIIRFNGGIVTKKFIINDERVNDLLTQSVRSSPLTLSREKALELLNDKIKNKNLIKHCLAVEAAMKALAQKFNGDEIKWGMAGLLHDGDWEVTQNDHARHAVQVVEWIKELGEEDPELLKTILVHNHHHNGENKPSTPMEWALYTCDELTGLIVATTLVMPTRKIQDVTVESVLKKFPAKSFAAGVNRDQIKMCEVKLNIPINEFVGIVLKSMQSIAQDLGL